eukprot:TRINITY_DN7083_c0_g1_i19.p1 TRINITY_DN7083_c0_g1~~TRINITY_DN7083_c0_g1_i19.p1  ORF type:complete len:166 (-),score=9.41 TRINITY_DN7083_c0_g1_i19:351-797(-)
MNVDGLVGKYKMIDTELDELNDLIDALKNCNENMQQRTNDFDTSMVSLSYVKGNACVCSPCEKAGEENIVACSPEVQTNSRSTASISLSAMVALRGVEEVKGSTNRGEQEEMDSGGHVIYSVTQQESYTKTWWTTARPPTHTKRHISG